VLIHINNKEMEILLSIVVTLFIIVSYFIGYARGLERGLTMNPMSIFKIMEQIKLRKIKK